MFTKEEESQVAGLLKQAQMLVMRQVNVYIDDWHFCEPRIPSYGEKIFIYYLGSLPVLGFVVINEFNRTVKAYDKNIELLKTWEIK